MRRKIKLVLGFGGLLLGITGCGTVREEEIAERGRYVEEVVELPMADVTYTNLVQKDSFIRLTSMNGPDLVSADGGREFRSGEMPSEEHGKNIVPNLLDMAGNAEGDRLFTMYEDIQCYKHMFISKTGESVSLDMFPSSQILQYFVTVDGSFIVLKDNDVYRFDSARGECTFLFESQGYPLYAAADGSLLYVAEEAGVWIFDLKAQEMKVQDEVLNAFLANKAGEYLLYPKEEEMYILTRDGLYLYELYSGNMIRLIDGTLCSMGDITRNYVGFAVVETEHKPEFLIYYSDGSLLRYVYDATLSKDPENVLKVYGMYEDGNVRQLITAFQKEHPQIYVKYEVGIDSDNGITPEDAMKKLSTEIVTGSGPDILFMDYLPYTSYREKWALMELGDIRNELEDSQYFVSVVDGFLEDGELYTIPLTFTIPVMGGEREKLGAESLSELAALLEEERKEKPNGSIFSFVDARGALNLLAQSSMGAWIQEDGTLSREEVKDFLTQSKRIYDAQMAGFSQEPHFRYTSAGWGTGENLFIRYFESYGACDGVGDAIMEFPGQSFYAGYLSNSKDDFPFFMGMLSYLEDDYAWMPGQKYGTALPSTLISISNTSEKKEEAMLFVEYALSENFQRFALLNGIPIHKKAYDLREICPHDTRQMYSLVMYSSLEGNDEIIEIYWPNHLDFYLLDGKVDRITGVNYCDRRVYEAVLEYGEAMLKEELSLEEAMDKIEKNVQLYLSE